MSAQPMARFVVGTGRCGSTLLSRMLSENERVLNVFELFSGIDQFFRFKPEPVTGPELAAQLRLDHPMLTMVMKRGGSVPEVVYPFDDPKSRYRLGDPVPWALAIAIPRISDAPDALFDALLEFVEGEPTAPLSVHYRKIFEWLTRRMGKACWLERSGNSIDYLGELQGLFPEARFVHIHRDGHEAALSMREYDPLRVGVVVMNGLVGEIEYSHEGLSRLEREKPHVIDALMKETPAVELFGAYWSDQIRRGYEARARLSADCVLDVRFEDLVLQPEPVLAEISEFLELPADDGFTARAAALSRGMPRLRAPELDPESFARLQASCEEAMALVGRSAG